MSPARTAYLRARLRLLPLMTGVGVVAGWCVFAMEDPAAFGAAWTSGAGRPAFGSLLHASASGLIYTLAMWNVVLEAKRVLSARWPISTWRTIAVHVVVIASASTAVFLLLQLVDPWICAVLGVADDGKEPPLMAIASVAFAFTAFVAALLYMIEFYRRLRHAEEARLQAELSALRAQINPHFLFNALNSIAALIRVAPGQAEGVTEHLADLFRYTLRASQHPTVSLREELDATQLYVEIEQVRFQDRLTVEVAVEPAVERAQVPSLLVQPLVENAVKHGVAQTEGPCTVRLHARRVQDADGAAVEVQVRDTGPGFDSVDEATVLARGTGLANVRDRLRLLYGPTASLRLLADGVVLRFPFRPVAAPAASMPTSSDGLPAAVHVRVAAGS